ncbi:GNAT family N-acetyltransferase [Tenacibaculum discolor]|uniref:GNAT family N-acetyltransferase n=1 Tax=Tenacibaculum discolor TaxID=361581 RepID=A0A2G1BUX5_9FLAO|nr:GNAT family N-acetyltransferase [Tenacibaculum discolor]MDP2541935.1 GNAT family N-acetyltransferase [Tenacibaculum discolor]PHN97649.1 GNAT family N-acetyltransferase [Tenacibaculum discolor]PHO01418.1 GNAT family N-acetyltransferase [Rhodobacteraceae bacterium 4F10]
MIFETKRLLIRKLQVVDIEPFYELESNPKVLQYATGEPKNLEESKKDLKQLIARYTNKKNDFWIYAIERKSDNEFVGTVALVKDEEGNDEIGYRFIERYWGNGFATELCEGLIQYCKSVGMKKLIGCMVDENIASAKILERFNFVVIEKFISDDIGLPETKYELIL